MIESQFNERQKKRRDQDLYKKPHEMALLSKNGYYLEKKLKVKDNYEEIMAKVQAGEKVSEKFRAKKDRYSQV
jgi:hypothetical protein